MGAAASARLGSIDALRGLTVAGMLLVNNPGDWGAVFAPLRHAEWHGCTPTDLVFPFFLFLVGVSMAFSVAPRAQDRAARPALAKGVLERALRIAIAGVLLQGLKVVGGNAAATHQGHTKFGSAVHGASGLTGETRQSPPLRRP